MIKNKYKKIVSAMLLMTMIATTFSVDVFAGGGASCISVECEGLFKGCCTKERSDSSKTECRATPTTPSSITVNGSGNSVINGSNTIIINQRQPQDEKEGHLIIGKEIEKKVVTDPITPPAHQPEPVSTHNDNTNYKFKKDTGQLILLSNYKGTEPIATYMDKSQLESIKTVNIERGVVRLVGTFHECYHLTSVIISDTVKEIGENAFADCKDLESVKIPASVTKIGAYAFKGCTSLTEVIIPDSVTEISEHAFDGCPVKPHKSDPPPEPHKSDVVIDPISPPTSFIPTEVTRVDNSIQANEEVVIDSITIPTSIILTEADKVDNSVQASEEIAKVEDSIQTSEPEVVIDSTTLPISTEVAKAENFTQTCEENTTSLGIPDDKGNCGDNVSYLFYKSTGELVIQGKGEMKSYLASEVSPWNKYKDEIQYVKIEDSVTSIGDRAFKDYTKLASVILGNGIEKIGNNAFSGCIGLTSLELPKNVKKIDKFAFWKCKNLKSVSIPNSVRTIDDWAFRDCTGLKEIKIPNGVIEIGGSSFLGCTGLVSVTIPNSVEEIGEWAFSGCKNLNSVIYFGKIDLNCKSAFNGCNIHEIQVPPDYRDSKFCGFDKINKKNDTDFMLNKKTGTLVIKRKGAMGDYSSSKISPWFNDKDKIKSVEIKDGVTYIGKRAFRDCKNLTDITIPATVKKISKLAFWKCTGLKSIDIPNNSIKTIDDWAFRECTSLKEIKIPNGVIKIGGSAFWGCESLTSVTIPNSVKEIGEWAFSGCKNLNSVIYFGKIDLNCKSAFASCAGLKEVSVTTGYKGRLFCGKAISKCD